MGLQWWLVCSRLFLWLVLLPFVVVAGVPSIVARHPAIEDAHGVGCQQRQAAALRQLDWDYFLCLFHYLKDFRAYLRSSDSRIPSAHHPQLMKLLGALGRAETAAVFDTKLAELRGLCTQLRCPQLMDRLDRNWVPEKHSACGGGCMCGAGCAGCWEM